jgi:addiction module RelB/DinJ family antitoxin
MKTEIRVRVDRQLKLDVKAILKRQDLTISDAIRYFLEAIVSGRYDPRQLLNQKKK